MMSVGDIKAAVGVVRCLRDDWDRASVEGQITTMAGTKDYSHADVLYAAVEIASDLNNRAPVTLTMKARDLLEALHSTTGVNRTPGPRKREDRFICDECGLTQDKCQTQASNLDGRDHPFITVVAAEVARERERAAKNPARAEAKAEVSKHWRPPTKGQPKGWSNVGQVPADVSRPSHPEPEQEEAAS